MRVDPERERKYREAYDAWQEQIQALHRVLLGIPALAHDGPFA